MLGKPTVGKGEVPVNFRNLLHRIVVLCLAITICVLLGCGETIEIDRARFSGRVVDEAGSPVVRLGLVIIPCDVGDDDTSIAVYIVFADGTPLANKAFDINIRTFDLHSGNVVGGIQGSSQTDAQGYFVQYVDENRATGYRVSVEYNGLCATSEDFVLKVREPREDLILKLTGGSK